MRWKSQITLQHRDTPTLESQRCQLVENESKHLCFLSWTIILPLFNHLHKILQLINILQALIMIVPGKFSVEKATLQGRECYFGDAFRSKQSVRSYTCCRASLLRCVRRPSVRRLMTHRATDRPAVRSPDDALPLSGLFAPFSFFSHFQNTNLGGRPDSRRKRETHRKVSALALRCTYGQRRHRAATFAANLQRRRNVFEAFHEVYVRTNTKKEVLPRNTIAIERALGLRAMFTGWLS